jgi:serine/threonine protein kinase
VDLTAGDKLGAYTIEKLLGTGGMGKVYLAHDDGLKRRTAIKVLQKRCA